jgi:hypothetical protein
MLDLRVERRSQLPAQTPPDSTPGLPLAQKDPDAKDRGEEQDDPSSRLAWQRQAWGIVTPAFRANAIKEGTKHSSMKNGPGPKWVSIGPTGAEFEQNGSFTGHVRDSGRARTILPHPTNPDIVYVLTSGGGLWRTNNWTSNDTRGTRSRTICRPAAGCSPRLAPTRTRCISDSGSYDQIWLAAR